LVKTEIIELNKTKMIHTLTRCRALGCIVTFPVAVGTGNMSECDFICTAYCAIGVLVVFDFLTDKWRGCALEETELCLI